MFGWFKKKPKTPGELEQYKQAVEESQDHPAVKRWFHQITPCKVVIPSKGAADFLMIEFRDGKLGAMVWSDGQGNWGTGGWLPLSAGVLPVEITYLQNALGAPTFGGVLDIVFARRQDAPNA